MCGCKKSKAGTVKSASAKKSLQPLGDSYMAQKSITQILSGDDFVDVIYMGPNHSHMVGSTNGIIREYGLKNYGFGKRGDTLRVHKSELGTRRGKQLFRLVNKTKPVTEEPKSEDTTTIIESGSLPKSVVTEPEVTEPEVTEPEVEEVNWNSVTDFPDITSLTVEEIKGLELTPEQWEKVYAVELENKNRVTVLDYAKKMYNTGE